MHTAVVPLSALALAIVQPAPLAADAPKAPSAETPRAAASDRGSRWLRVPSEAEFFAVYPLSLACKAYVGDAYARCRVTKEGALADCIITRAWSSNPESFGAAETTLKLAPYYRLDLSTAAGKAAAAAGTVEFLGHFPGARCDETTMVPTH